jgi:hypothetical protein
MTNSYTIRQARLRSAPAPIGSRINDTALGSRMRATRRPVQTLEVRAAAAQGSGAGRSVDPPSSGARFIAHRRWCVALTSSMAYCCPSALRSLRWSGLMHWRRDLVPPREANMRASKRVVNSQLPIKEYVCG